MKTVIKRLLFVGFAQLLGFEVLAQASVHWRESTEELRQMALMLAVALGLIWAALPSFCEIRLLAARIGCRAALVVVAFVAVYAADYLYSWHLRPNLGLYREPDWVADHPGFQRQLRQRISNNTWKSTNPN